MTISLKATGGAELEAALRELGGAVAGRLGNNATKAAARLVAAEVRRKVSVRTGTLRQSIKVVGDE
jgi:Bacteriophage HK97-gp10, putative tail-component